MDPASILLSLTISVAGALPPSPADCRGCETIEQLLLAERFFDAHTLALAHLAHPENDSARTQVRLFLLCARAQQGLGDVAGVAQYLDMALGRAEAPADRDQVLFLRAWTRRVHGDEPYLDIWSLRQPDRRARAAYLVYEAILADEPLPPQVDIFAGLGLPQLIEAYQDRPRTYAELAGLLNALVPGAGYVYLGAWESALQTLVLNGAFIAAAIEFGLRENIAPTIVSALVATFFYVGGIAGAARSALRRDELSEERARRPIEYLLFPQSSGW